MLTGYADEVTDRPIVFSGEMRGGNWYAVGGKSYLAQQIRDAGGEYFLKDDQRSGGVSSTSRRSTADPIRLATGESSTAIPGVRLRSFESRRQPICRFQGIQGKGVIYCNLRETAFYELMPMHPDWVLADLIAILHPRLLPDHQPHFYYLLQ